jgi:hypothetical protein
MPTSGSRCIQLLFSVVTDWGAVGTDIDLSMTRILNNLVQSIPINFKFHQPAPGVAVSSRLPALPGSPSVRRSWRH